MENSVIDPLTQTRQSELTIAHPQKVSDQDTPKQPFVFPTCEELELPEYSAATPAICPS